MEEFYPLIGFLVCFFLILYLLPEIPTNEDGEEILWDEGQPKKEKCSTHKWSKDENGLKCSQCDYRPKG